MAWNTSKCLCVLLSAAWIGWPATLVAQFTMMTLRTDSALNGANVKTWSVASPGSFVGAPISTSATSIPSLTVQKSTGGFFTQYQQSNNWGGNFTPGDFALGTHNSTGLVTLNFGSTGVSAAGVQLQSFAGGSFTAQVEALNSSNQVVATYTRTGTSDGSANNSAIFLGVKSTQNNINQLRYSVTTGSPTNDFAFNQLSYNFIAAPPTYYLVSSRNSILNDYSYHRVDWLAQGVGTTHNSPFTVSSTNNPTGTRAVTISQLSNAPFQVRQVPGSWTGNFASGDGVLWNGLSGSGNASAVTINFNGPSISRAGVQITPNFTGSFTAQIEALDINNNVLATFQEGGNMTTTPDNSAIFLGIGSNDANPLISKIRISLIGAPSQDFAINRLEFNAVPEPTTWALIGLGVAGCSWVGYRRWRNDKSILDADVRFSE